MSNGKTTGKHAWSQPAESMTESEYGLFHTKMYALLTTVQ